MTWPGAEGGGAASFLSGRGAPSRWLGQAAPAAGQPLRAPFDPRGLMLAPKAALLPPELGTRLRRGRRPLSPRRSGKSPRRALASGQRGAGGSLLAIRAEPNPELKAEQTPERRGPHPPPTPPRRELRPSPNFPAASPVVSRPAHEYLYGADLVSALGRAHQSLSLGRSLRAPNAQPSLRRSECPLGHARCMQLESFYNLGIDRGDAGFCHDCPHGPQCV